MKTRFLDYKKAILSAISAVNLLAMVGIFAFTWYNFYRKRRDMWRRRI